MPRCLPSSWDAQFLTPNGLSGLCDRLWRHLVRLGRSKVLAQLKRRYQLSSVVFACWRAFTNFRLSSRSILLLARENRHARARRKVFAAWSAWYKHGKLLRMKLSSGYLRVLQVHKSYSFAHWHKLTQDRREMRAQVCGLLELILKRRAKTILIRWAEFTWNSQTQRRKMDKTLRRLLKPQSR